MILLVNSCGSLGSNTWVQCHGEKGGVWCKSAYTMAAFSQTAVTKVQKKKHLGGPFSSLSHGKPACFGATLLDLGDSNNLD